jgi:hypothetical protein
MPGLVGPRDAVPLYGDMFGDWREEFLAEQSGGATMRIYTTTMPTDKRIYCLMHDPEYRNSMCEKGYIQSHEIDYYLGMDMTDPPKPNMTYPGVVSTLPRVEQAVGSTSAFETKTIKILAGKSFTVPGFSEGASPTLSVYTCLGKLVAQGKVTGRTVNLEKKFGLPYSMFVVKMAKTGMK